VATADLIPDLVRAVIAEMPWPKSMRWAEASRTWVRPLRSILCTLEGVPIEFDVDLGNGETLTSGKTTSGHRFLGASEVETTTILDYKHALLTNKVLLDPAERRAVIERDADAAVAKLGCKIKTDPGLLAEVAGLVEWPIVLVGRIEDRFMAVPPEVLVLTMRTNQKYFATETEDGKLAPYFVTVSNIETADAGAKIIAGNERVLRARLSDAEFFWTQDQKARLDSRVDALNALVFHAKLGSVGDKVSRVQKLASHIAPYIADCDAQSAARAALLAKADLTTGMVGEFPELQGVMGRYYAQLDGEAQSVADAIRDHYAPLGPNDACPTAPVSVAVALADKIDTLTGFFAIDERPTGSKDPFALRRAALGIIRLILENKLRLPLRTIFDAAGQGAISGYSDVTREALVGFIFDRLKVSLKESGVQHDLITAVLALGEEDDLVRLLARVEALGTFLAGEDGVNLLAAYRRATNILRIEEKKDGSSYTGEAKANLLSVEPEKTLFEKLGAATGECRAAVAVEDFTTAMAALASLRQPVDRFFDAVLVNDPDTDIRANRLRLLSGIRDALGSVADFGQIEGGGGDS
ncbi:MAG: glycine--tRNA ligase subunit beta, partial [Pseudomonadota bacterium]